MAKIYEEIKQVNPEHKPAQTAAITIFRTADVLHHAIERSLSPFGVSHEQYNVLRILRGAGENGLPTLEISSRLVSRSPNTTRLLDRLIAKKLARRSRLKRDRRVVLVHATPQGLELLTHLDRVVDRLFERFPRTTQAEMETLLNVLDRIRERMAVKTTVERSLKKAPRARR